MSEEMKEITAVPTLTFEPFESEQGVLQTVRANEPSPEDAVFDESSLTDAEKKMVQDFASKIELSNSSMVLQYGAGAQKKMADFSESALNNVRTKDLGEIGGMLSNVVTQLKSFDVE